MFHGNMKKFKRMAIIGSTQKLQQKIVFILPELPNWFEMAKLRLFIHSYGFRLNKNYYMYNLDVKNLLQKDFPCVLEFMTLQIMSQHIHIASNFNNLILLCAWFYTNIIPLWLKRKRFCKCRIKTALLFYQNIDLVIRFMTQRICVVSELYNWFAITCCVIVKRHF